MIRPYLLYPENVIYHVVDSNSELCRIGKKYAKSIESGDRIVFHADLPEKDNFRVDVLYINTALQYIYNYPSLLISLLNYGPQYVILTRLIAGDMKTYITRQNIYGHNTPCVFCNFQEIVDIFVRNGFNLVFKSPCAEEVLEGLYDNNIPEHCRIHNTANLIFKRAE